MFLSLVKILHSFRRRKAEVCLLFAKLFLEWYSLVKQNLQVFFYPLNFLKRICSL